MRIAEIYTSVQGEGFLTGTESVFVRASGCNLRCRYCDTPYASWHPEGDDMSVHEIMARVRNHELRHVVLTGGEPMLFSELIPLCERLRGDGWHVTVETAGTLYLPLSCDLVSISPKTTNSRPDRSGSGRWWRRHERARFAPTVVRRLVRENDYQIKFVVSHPCDLIEIEGYLGCFPEIERERVMLMPEGTDQPSLAMVESWLESACRRMRLTFCPRKQIEWFGLLRGT